MADKVLNLNEGNFDATVNEGKPVLVDFWASWCGPCRMMSPVVEQVAQEYEGRLTVAKVNVDETPELAQRFMVMNIPTLVLIKGGETVDRIVGARSPRDLKAWLDKQI